MSCSSFKTEIEVKPTISDDQAYVRIDEKYQTHWGVIFSSVAFERADDAANDGNYPKAA